MSSINLTKLVEQHNTASPDGFQYILIDPVNLAFLEKIREDNGCGDLTVAANITLSQGALAFRSYEANMRARHAREDRAGTSDRTTDRFVDVPHLGEHTHIGVIGVKATPKARTPAQSSPIESLLNLLKGGDEATPSAEDLLRAAAAAFFHPGK